MNLCLKGCFLGSQSKPTSYSYLDASLLLIIPYLGNIMRMFMCFYIGKFIYTYIFIYAITAVTGNRNVREGGTGSTFYEDHLDLK